MGMTSEEFYQLIDDYQDRAQAFAAKWEAYFREQERTFELKTQERMERWNGNG